MTKTSTMLRLKRFEHVANYQVYRSRHELNVLATQPYLQLNNKCTCIDNVSVTTYLQKADASMKHLHSSVRLICHFINKCLRHWNALECKTDAALQLTPSGSNGHKDTSHTQRL
jgi:hypothetical protein